MRKIVEKTESYLALAGAAFVFVLMFVTVIDVSGRFLFNHPMQGAYEVSELLLVAIVFPAVAYVQFRKGHVQVILFETHLSKRAIVIMELFGTILGLGTYCIMAWQATSLAWNSILIKEYGGGVVPIPIWPGKMAFAFGIVLLCVQLILDVMTSIRLVKESSHAT